MTRQLIDQLSEQAMRVPATYRARHQFEHIASQPSQRLSGTTTVDDQSPATVSSKKRSGFVLFALSLALACFDVHSATAQDVIVENGSSAADETIDQERSQQRSTAFNPFVLTAHRQNYFLPISNTSSMNQAVYDEFDPELANGLSDNEVKFQFSVRVLANEHELMLAERRRLSEYRRFFWSWQSAVWLAWFPL